ncbi:hypothetical protein BH09BAC5_BH09BAC5_09710 [soil metagenome]
MTLQQNKRIAIIGIGPVGMILAVHFKEAGYDVALCDLDKVKMNLIRTNGVVLEGAMNRKENFENIFCTINELSEFKPNIIFVCLKAPHLPGAMLEVAKLKDPLPFVICAMNGIDVEQMVSDVIGESRTFRLVINFAGNLTDPYKSKVTFFNPPNYLASMDDSERALAESVSSDLSAVGLETHVTSSFEILKRIWEKTILNSSLSALCAVGRMTIREAMSNPDTVELVEQIIEEAVEVAEAEKIKFEDEFIRKCLRYLNKAGDHFPSLAVDLLNNRPTEIDFMNGKIVDYGRKHYIRTSLNLTFTNMVKAISEKVHKNVAKATTQSLLQNSVLKKTGSASSNTDKSCYLGVDLGSAYTKFTLIDSNEKLVFQSAVKTLNREKISVRHILEALKKEYKIVSVCSTGYGRKHFPEADFVKTELNCAALGASKYKQGEKNIIDIGGEDIKIIKTNSDDQIENFYLNDKCAAGTGSFITEVAERAGLQISEMSDLASKSKFNKELNSFCTVFAKTEIMGWLFEGFPVEDIARGIYYSIINRVIKLRIDASAPVMIIGGVIAYHPLLKSLLEERLKKEIFIVDNPQFIVSFGAALFAKEGIEKSAEENGKLMAEKK